MGRTLITALLLAHNAANAVVYPELLPTPTKVLNHLVAAAAAATGESGVDACSIALGVVSSCGAIAGFTDAPVATQAACLCCASQTVELGEYYSSCADYIESNYPKSSTQYSALSGIASACAVGVPTCGVGAAATGTSTSDDSSETEATGSPTRSATGSGGGTGTSPSRTTATGVGGGVGGGIPSQCTSLTDIIASCTSATPALTAATAKDSDVASCACYATRGGTSSFTTALDDLATECAPWAKTAATSAYSAISALEGFCASYEPTGSDDSPSETTTPATTSRPVPGGGGGGPGLTTSANSSPRTSATTASRSSSVSPNPGAHTTPGGVVVWAANLASLVLSFFAFL